MFVKGTWWEENLFVQLALWCFNTEPNLALDQTPLNGIITQDFGGASCLFVELEIMEECLTQAQCALDKQKGNYYNNCKETRAKQPYWSLFGNTA